MLCHDFASDLSANLPDAVDESIVRSIAGDFAGRSFADEFLAQLDLDSPAPRVVDASRLTDGGCVCGLDVGTGTARIPIEICTRRGDIRFTAVDRATRTSQTATRNVEQAGLAGVIGIEIADAASLPFANAAFDAVISNSLLHHVANQLGALREMARVLRPGGFLLIRDTLKGLDADQIAQILSRDPLGSHNVQPAFDDVQTMLNIDEARDLALAAGVPGGCVRQSGPRHWILKFKPQPAPAEVNRSRRPPAQAQA